MKMLISKILIMMAVVIIVSCNTAIPQTGIGTKNIVLVHGAFADGSGWEAVFNILKSRGYNVSVVQNPLTSLEDDVAATERILENQDGPVVLVGHSWGGSVITQAGVSPKVVSLVYVAAFAPNVGESTLDLIKTVAPAPENGILLPDDKGLIYYDKAKFRLGFAADLNQEKADFMYASQMPVSVKSFITPLTQAAWKTKPSFAIVATDDKSINPDLERTMYKRAGSKVTEVKSSHVVYISNAKAVADVIEIAAKASPK
jgi:pimeloyl-ACP methyl ester carboxylesterase